jgi:hypothetical protein
MKTRTYLVALIVLGSVIAGFLVTRGGEPTAVVSYELWFTTGSPIAGELIVETESGSREAIPITIPGQADVRVPREGATVVTVVSFGNNRGLRCQLQIVGFQRQAGAANSDSDRCEIAFVAADMIERGR